MEEEEEEESRSTQAALLVNDGRVQPHSRRVPNSICINQPGAWVLKRAEGLAGADCWVEEAAPLSGRCIPSQATAELSSSGLIVDPLVMSGL